MAIHIRTVVSLAYLFDGEDGYTSRAPYNGVATLLHLDDKRVEVVGLHHDHLTTKAYNEIAAALRSMGIEVVEGERHKHTRQWFANPFPRS